MKQNYLSYVRQHPYCSFGQICSFYDGRKDALLLQIQQDINQGILIEEDGTYVLPETLGLLLAQITSVKRDYAFAMLYETKEEVHIDGEYMEDALLGDWVYLRYHYSFRVVKQVRRENTSIVGSVKNVGKRNILVTHGYAVESTIFVLREGDFQEDDLLLAEIEKYDGKQIWVRPIKNLGNLHAPHLDVTRILLEQGCPTSFPEEVEQETASLPQIVEPKDKEGRVDLTHEFILTIDGKDSRDLDDAISCQKDENGHYHIGVHIADVSYYVRPDSSIDQEAYRRGTSIYVTDRVVPMLPFPLSNGICSLNPNEERLAISLLATLNEQGDLLEKKIVPSVIISSHRMTYDEVNEMFSKKEPENELEKRLFWMREVAHLLQKKKKEQGELQFQTREVKVHVDTNGAPTSLEIVEQKEAEKLIESWMIFANETIAETLSNLRVPSLYRIHETPPAKKMEVYLSFLRRFGYRPNFSSMNVKPIDIQRFLEEQNRFQKSPVLNEWTLRTIAKARYSDHNKGHFGLASSCYTHFTSPIRRYPDLIVHRLVRKFLFEQDQSHLSELELYLMKAGEDCSLKERRAIAVEREVVDYKCAEYMKNYIGYEFHGYISGMQRNAIYVSLDNGVDGKIRLEDCADFYVVDESCFQAIGQRKHRRYRLGDALTVLVDSVLEKQGEVRVIPLQELQIMQEKARRKKKR